MVTTSDIHLTMHREHQEWRGDCDLWKDDIRVWKGEIRNALAALKDVERALKEQLNGLGEHERLIEVQETSLAGHEGTIAEFEQGGLDEALASALVQWVRDHERDEATRHDQRQMIHERIKRYHHNVVAKVALLQAAIAGPV